MKKIAYQISVPISIFIFCCAMVGAYVTYVLFKYQITQIEQRNLAALGQSRVLTIIDYVTNIKNTTYLWSNVLTSQILDAEDAEQKKNATAYLVENLDTHGDFTHVYLMRNNKVLLSLNLETGAYSITTDSFERALGFIPADVFPTKEMFSPFLKDTNGKSHLFVRFPNPNGVSAAYTLIAEISLEKLFKSVSSKDVNDAENSYIIDEKNTLYGAQTTGVQVGSAQLPACRGEVQNSDVPYIGISGRPSIGKFKSFTIGSDVYCLGTEVATGALYAPIIKIALLIALSFTGLVCIISLFLNIRIRRLLQPLTTLSQNANDIVTGDLQKEISEAHTNNEIEVLNTSVRQMVKTLREEDFRHQLISKVSHELRTPMTVVRGYVELILGDAESHLTTKSKERIQKIDEQVKYLITFVNEILDLHKLQSGKVVFKKIPIRAQNFIEDLQEFSSILFTKKNITVHFETNTQDTFVADYDKLKQIFANILSNAYKYTPEKGSVHVTVAQQVHTLSCTVTDTGKGMSAEQLKNAFKEYATVDTGSVELQSTGLGLPITKELVERMGGTITLTSKVGKGTTVSFILPQ